MGPVSTVNGAAAAMMSSCSLSNSGVGHREYLDRMLTEPFEPFTFSPAGAAVYQLGPFGTAAKKLKEWDSKH